MNLVIFLYLEDLQTITEFVGANFLLAAEPELFVCPDCRRYGIYPAPNRDKPTYCILCGACLIKRDAVISRISQLSQSYYIEKVSAKQ
ncbi:MAG: hypothetical protein MUO26_06030 [Methanotrichaceae archaeon]|nr:hypothetical protein [Methanotrichaceae archaeon]